MEIPIVNIRSKKISGCGNDLEMYHEIAHLEFSESNLGMNIQYFQGISEFYTIISIVLTFFINWFKWFSLIGIILMIGLFTFEEIYCNIKADEKFEQLQRLLNKVETKDLNI